MSDVNINPNSANAVTIQNVDNNVTITDSSKSTEVNVTQETTKVVNVASQGPQGTQGAQGPAGQGLEEPFTGSLIISGSIEVIGDQTISGSLTISGSSTFTNIGPAIFSGSVTTTQGFTGSLSGTASYADMATTASHALFAISASHEIVKEVSSSHANTADIAGGLQGQPSIYVTNITASGGISSSNGIITATTGSFNHIITDDDTIEFRNKNTGAQTGRLKFDASTGLNVQNALGARTKIRAGRGEFLSLEAGVVGFNSLGSITASGDISSSANIFATSFTGIFNGALSSSAQIASDISGAFASPFTAAGISGSFNAASSSFSTRITTNETNITTLTAATSSYLTSLPSGVLSSSAQIASDISGAFSATSSSLASRTSTLETKTSYSGSFSGSFEGNGSGLTNIPAAGIVGLNLSQIASGSATASISPNLGLVVNTNVSSSATSTASFGTYLGDGSQLSGISTTPFPFTGDAQITGSLIVSGAFEPRGLGGETNVIIGGAGAGSSISEVYATHNVIIGYDAAEQLNDEDYNVIIGSSAGNSITHGQYNVLIGGRAGRNFKGTTGNKIRGNTLVGHYAGYGGTNVNSFSANNTGLGEKVLHEIDGGSGSIAIGYFAGYNIGSGNNNIIIGSGSLGTTTMNDQLRIGHADLHVISASLETGDIILQGNVSSSAVSTASFGTYLGDGSQLSGISSGGGGATEEFVWFMA